MKVNKLHDDQLPRIVDMLKERGYHTFHTNMDYSINGVRGEVDVLCMKGERVLFVEYKLHHCYKQKRKAREQFSRFYSVWDSLNVKGLYIAGGYDTPLKIARLFPKGGATKSYNLIKEVIYQ